MAATDTTRGASRVADTSVQRTVRKQRDETKPSFLTTEFYAMVGVIAAVLIAAKVSDSLGDVRAWTLVAAVAIGYMISRGLAKSGTKYAGGEDPLSRTNH